MKLFLVVVGLFIVALAEGNKEALLALQNPDLYGGDMSGIDGPFDAERNAIPGDQFRWPNAVVPYVVDSSLNEIIDIWGVPVPTLIQEAFKVYHNTTCVRFVPRTIETDYIRIFSGTGCYSNVGRTGGQQPLSIGKNCDYLGTVIHELGHALGFYHEQSRSDRDTYLTIYWENITAGKESNFFKQPPTQNILYNSFDYDSIMIYGNKAFSKNEEDTMVAKNGQTLYSPFDKLGMTESDIKRVRKMYNC